MDTFEKHWRGARSSLFRLARNVATGVEDAEDLLADTALRAFESFGSFDPSSSFVNWASRMMVRLWLDALRAKRRRVETISISDLEQDPYEWATDHVARDESECSYQALLSLVPDRDRGLFASLAQGQTAVEIARQEGAPQSTIRTRIFRARMRALETASLLN